MATPELDFITVQGFKSIASQEGLALGKINVVIGANGSGKSNFIEVFSFLNAIRQGQLQSYTGKAGGADGLLHYGAKVTDNIKIGMSWDGGTNGYEIVLKPTADDSLFAEKEWVSYWDKDKYPDPFNSLLVEELVGREARISLESRLPITNWVRKRLLSWRVYHVHDTSRTSKIRQTSDLNDNKFLRPDAGNLAAFLYLLKEAHPSSYRLIVRTVQQIAPFFGDFQLEPSRLNPSKILLEWSHRDSDKYFNAAAFSDGTLRFIALATLLLQPLELRPSIILMDEPELGLHPFATTLLAGMVKSAAATSQVLMTTQSPLLLDQFEPQDVLVANRSQGGTVFSRLAPDSLATWLEEYSLGQLWEKNELGGRPVQE